MKYQIAIDETGKCPVLGSISMCCVVIKSITFFRKYSHLGIKDSKLLSPKQIKSIYERTSKDKDIEYYYEYITPLEIRMSQEQGFNLNDVEMRHIISLLNNIKEFWKHEIYLDNFEHNREHFTDRFDRMAPLNLKKEAIEELKKKGSDFFKNFKIEHNSDFKHKVTGLASIYAKYFEEKETDENKLIWGEFGSKNPNDLKTLAFLYKNLAKDTPSPIIRTTWETWKRLKESPEEVEILRQKLQEADLI